MTLWLRAVLGSHLRIREQISIDTNEIEADVSKKLASIGVPNPCCDVNEDEDGCVGIAVGARMDAIDTAGESDHKHSPLPSLTAEQIKGIRTIAEELAEQVTASGYTGTIKITDGLAIHATS